MNHGKGTPTHTQPFVFNDLFIVWLPQNQAPEKHSFKPFLSLLSQTPHLTETIRFQTHEIR